ncbi:transporter substrate-binding domain-containing protein [Janthinobacterium sp. SUN118]|uniref:substrate-binding periplasmic protein n=1 Tax=Janthinobacterium sp. SUN118 TaxID=3004100 RepID=UPI0025AEDBBB|nr:transporter substrate-binding domain-containing protein [Janthinobacterium sp. SUN118]MDN2713267.1 transporter substrate-binding domain-containing protein [Janthinobacterium sp. SUN118]
MRSFQLRGARAMIAFACLALCTAAPVRADWQKVQQSGSLKVAVYSEFAPFSDKGAGIDIDIAEALAKKLGLKLSLLPFPAGENLNDDLRNMVWKGHYLGYGPADVMLHVPVDKKLMADNDKVEIFAPYYVETVRLARRTQAVPQFDGVTSLAGKRIGVEKVSIAAMLMLGEDDGKYRDDVRIFDTAAEALQQLQAGQLDAVLANRSEIESVLKSDPAFAVNEVAFARLPRAGWAVGLAVSRQQLDVGKLLLAAMNEMAVSGELKAIFEKHGVKEARP